MSRRAAQFFIGIILASITAFAVILAPSQQVAFIWAAGGVLVGAIFGRFLPRPVIPKIVASALMVVGVLVAQATSKFIPDQTWFPAIAGAVFAYVTVISLTSPTDSLE